MIRSALAIAILSAASAGANAALADIDFYLGNGVSGQGFTVGTGAIPGGEVQIALRARDRFPTATNNVVYDPVAQAYRYTPGTTGLASWNFDWSVAILNTTNHLGDFSYRMGVSFAGTDNQVVYSFMTDANSDPVNMFSDNEFGDSGLKTGFPATGPNGVGAIALSDLEYQVNLLDYDVLQNSWNLGFFSSLLPKFDGSAEGTYKIFLEFLDENGRRAGGSDISVIVAAAVNPNPVPEPNGLALVGIALAGLAVVRRRRNTQSQRD